MLFYKFEVDQLPPYLWEGRYEKIRNYLDSCKLTDFDDFSNTVIDQFMFLLQTIIYQREFTLIEARAQFVNFLHPVIQSTSLSLFRAFCM